MSAVDAVSPIAASAVTAAVASPTAAASQSGLQGVDYMSLLLAQLKNQDPSSPMDATQMVAQTTQLGMLQQLTQLESDTSQALTFQMRQTAATLVGRTVTYTDSGGRVATGQVDGVTFGSSTPTVTIGGASVGLGSVLGVTGTDPSASTGRPAAADAQPAAAQPAG